MDNASNDGENWNLGRLIAWTLNFDTKYVIIDYYLMCSIKNEKKIDKNLYVKYLIVTECGSVTSLQFFFKTIFRGDERADERASQVHSRAI